MMRFAAVVAKTERAIGARVERYRLRRSCGARLPSMEPTVHQVARRFRPLRPLLGVSPLVVWFTATCLAYYYKPLMCGGVVDSLGAGGFCDASVRGISMNQWAEIVLYCPSMWLGLHLSKRDVFEGARVHRGERHSLQRQELAADLGIALLLYGYGLHVANVIEIHSRRDARITSGSVYDLTYFLDEDLSHYVIQLSLFFVLGWLIAYDRPDRVEGATVALLIGVAHGVERGVSFVESGKSFFVLPVLSWFVFAVVTRWRRHDRNWRRCSKDFFCRYTFSFCVMLPITVAWYRVAFDSFTQPSRLLPPQVPVLGFGMVALTVLGSVVAVVVSSTLHRPSTRSPGGTAPDVDGPPGGRAP